ncbi:MAG: adenylate/guanylate cyclase domain-containing protein, partial [Bacteroidota bacterium]
LSEQMTPKENFKFVSSFNQRIGPIIQQNHGFINQYLGDGVMAIFTEKTDDTLNAAISMQKDLIAYNQLRKQTNRSAIRMGIGLHAGPLIMGIIGDDERMDAAIISDTVNAASRLERLTKYFGVSIIASDKVIDNLENRDNYNLRYLGLVQVKGKQAAIKIYECFDGEEAAIKKRKLATKTQFNKGVMAYFSKEFELADSYLKAVIEQHPEDYTAQLFYDKNKQFMLYGAPPNWTGVEITYSIG